MSDKTAPSTATEHSGDSASVSSTMSIDAPPFVPRFLHKELSPNAPEFPRPRKALSANAPEFVSPLRLSINAREFVPLGYQSMQNGYARCVDPLPEVHRVVEKLTSCPADFDVVVEPLMRLISECVHDTNVINAVIEELFNQTLQEANFRYSGARICRYLSVNLQLPTGSFERLLLNKCFSHYRELSVEAHDSSDEAVSGFATFALLLGELIVNMHDARHVMAELPQVLKELLLILLGITSDEALGAVSRILKLTGNVLRNCNVEIEDVLTHAKSVTRNISTPQAILLTSVLNQFSKNSNKPPRNSVLMSRSRARNYGIDLEPIYYDHSGQAFSADEKELMDSCGGVTYTEEYGDEQDTKDDDVGDEMDPEIEAAFDQFLRELDESIVSPSVQPPRAVPPYYANGSQLALGHQISGLQISGHQISGHQVSGQLPVQQHLYNGQTGDSARPMAYAYFDATQNRPTAPAYVDNMERSQYMLDSALLTGTQQFYAPQQAQYALSPMAVQTTLLTPMGAPAAPSHPVQSSPGGWAVTMAPYAAGPASQPPMTLNFFNNGSVVQHPMAAAYGGRGEDAGYEGEQGVLSPAYYTDASNYYQ